MIVAFDLDGGLVENDAPNLKAMALLMAFHALGADIIVWTSTGQGNAVDWGKRLWLPSTGIRYLFKPYSAASNQEEVDISFDHAESQFGTVNVRI